MNWRPWDARRCPSPAVPAWRSCLAAGHDAAAQAGEQTQVRGAQDASRLEDAVARLQVLTRVADVLARHGLDVELGSLMERVYGDGEIRVNSMHHMAVDDIATDFASTARCPDGIVEAIECRLEDWLAMGTQFHPEASTASALDLRIFEEFVAGVCQTSEAVRLVA